jgi:quercetin dioxygenase-like cupin family protein
LTPPRETVIIAALDYGGRNREVIMNLARNTDVKGRKLESLEGKPVRGEVITKHMMEGERMTFLEIQYAPGAGAPIHVHQHESIAYVVKGKVKMTVGNEVYELSAGDVCKHPQGVPHTVEGIEQSLVVEVKSPVQPLDQFLGTVDK